MQDLSARLIHVFADNTFTRPCFDFASDYIKDRLADRFIATKQTTMRNFLISHNEDSIQYSALWDYMFELLTISMLSTGRAFRRRNLTTGALVILTAIAILWCAKHFDAGSVEH